MSFITRSQLYIKAETKGEIKMMIRNKLMITAIKDQAYKHTLKPQTAHGCTCSFEVYAIQSS